MLGKLHVITDCQSYGEMLDSVALAVDSGVRVVQIRAKGLGDRHLYEISSEAVKICSRADATCIVNDRVDIALASDAHGVHLGEDDLPIALARSLLGPDAVIGATVRDPKAAVLAVSAGADYLGVGPCYASITKQGLPSPLGPGGIAVIAAVVDIPVIGIGGIDASRVPSLLDAGAYGVAVVGAVSRAADPSLAISELLAALGES